MTEPHKRAYRHPKYKTAYRVKNWPDDDKSLRDRGDLTLWISQDAMDAWMAPNSGKRGAQPIDADIAIETALTLRLLFRLPLRQAEGFLGSVLKLMALALPCPDHTTLSRRNATFESRRFVRRETHGPVDVIVDSTGVKGVWSGRMADPATRREEAETLEKAAHGSGWAGADHRFDGDR